MTIVPFHFLQKRYHTYIYIYSYFTKKDTLYIGIKIEKNLNELNNLYLIIKIVLIVCSIQPTI